VVGLGKQFRKLEAVRQLTFGVRPGECFGLLGVNGAGKTTTFRMLTGEEVPSRGGASILGHPLRSARRRFLGRVGYCPQADAILPQLTGRELLRLMCRARGVAPRALEDEVHRWSRFFGIQELIDRQSGGYSGGNKRKLNVAMALVGDPPVVLLDEPSTGVDPVARRNLWTIIRRIQRNGQAVVLTSHSMEECEALCDRLAIMVNGQFQCFGSSQHLKSRFAQGFTVLARLQGEDVARRVKAWVGERLPGVTVQDEYTGFIHFHVARVWAWSQLFRVMESARRELPGLEDYTVSQTSLEQVFLSFARQQDGALR
jgi:ATP-binding cassette subfamily A (ABC1) protein 3